MKEKRAVCICASDIQNSQGGNIPERICEILRGAFAREGCAAETLDLRDYSLLPCDGCGGCSGACARRAENEKGISGGMRHEQERCVRDRDFNRLYATAGKADFLFFVSPHHAPIPARLCMFLEKIRQLAVLPGWRDPSYRPGLSGRLSGIISYGAAGEGALMNDKAMVNDTIADALGSARVKVVPFNSRWNTGISLPACGVKAGEGGLPVREYDWKRIGAQVETYAEIVVQTGRTLHAIL